jgi:Secretion system C-terminal sorting domain
MKSGMAVLSMILMLAWAAFASPVVEGPATALTGNEEINLPTNLIGWTPQQNVLDVIGDTVHVGTTAWDAQHNAGVGRMIGYTDAGNGTAHFVWAKLTGLIPSNPRHVVHGTAAGDGGGGYNVATALSVENGYRSGYANLPYNVAGDNEYPVFHYSPTNGAPWGSYAFIENPFVPTLYNGVSNTDVFVNLHIWPHGAYSSGYVHTVSHEQRVGNADLMQISYMRWEVNDAIGLLSPATGDGDPILLTDNAMNIAGDVTANDAGTKVAIGAVMGRYGTIGEDFGQPGQDDQWNNDLYIFESLDGGLTWDAGTDVTQYIGVDYNALPDTLAANGDTMRVYSDCSVIYDGTDHLRAAFTVNNFDFLRVLTYYESRIYHWMEDGDGNDVWTMINHQPFAGQTETWGRTTDRPCLYFDDDTGILWCVMEVAEWGPDGYDVGSNTGMANTDIYVSASPPGEYNGLLWTKPVNVTNTKWTSPIPAPAGSCQSESDPSIALDSDGDNLHMMYVLDLDAGTGISATPEGDVTDNPVVYHVIAKQALLDEFEGVGEWLVNYPMHMDETGHWVDPGDWAWAEYGGFFTTNRDPDPDPVTLTLTGINTTIPQAGGNVTYMASLVSMIGQAYNGLRYWTRATLPNNQQTGVLFQQNFNLTPFMNTTVGPIAQQIPNYAPGGTYTYHGYVGFYPVPSLEDSFTFIKLGVAADGEFEFIPEDWASTMPAINGDETGETVAVPTHYAMSQAYPNPFNAMTTVTIALPDASNLTVTVFNTLGQQVAELVNGRANAGTQTLTFDASDLSSGIYFIQATVPGKLDAIQKVVLVR